MSSIPVDRQVYRLPIKVNRTDIDDLNHVNNVVYVSWIQDAAAAHWNSAASEALRRQCRWVVLRHEINYLSSAVEGEELEAFTWVDPATGVRQNRHVLIQRVSDQKVMATAQTTWCLLDPVSEKPKRIGPEIEEVIRLKS
ncbi:MAG: acyl-CoA thioesterase [Cyclobacteriaceae bacterium]|nr:acyl-CoA thioesterase [Cyclobacteriaceae bacterium]